MYRAVDWLYSIYLIQEIARLVANNNLLLMSLLRVSTCTRSLSGRCKQSYKSTTNVHVQLWHNLLLFVGPSGLTSKYYVSYKILTVGSSYQLLFFHDWAALIGLGLLIFEVSWPHSDTPRSVALHCANDRPDSKTSTWQNTTLATDRQPCSRRDLNPRSQQPSVRRPTP